MAATGNEAVLLRQLKNLYDALAEKINDVAGGTPATGTVTTDSIANNAVTTGKIAADAVTADKIATGAVTSDAIANGTITAADIASGVIPDVSDFITSEDAAGAYAPLSHTHAEATTSAAGFMSAADKTKLNGLSNYTLSEATSTKLGGVKIATDEDAKAFLGY